MNPCDFLLLGSFLAFGSGCQRSKRTLLETAPMNARPELIEASRQSGGGGQPMRNPFSWARGATNHSSGSTLFGITATLGFSLRKCDASSGVVVVTRSACAAMYSESM